MSVYYRNTVGRGHTVTCRRLRGLSICGAALVCMLATSVDAGWYRTRVTVVARGASHGSHGASTGSWGSHGSHGGSLGSHGGLLHRLHHRLQHLHSYGSFGSHGSSGGSYGKVYWGSCGSQGGAVRAVAPEGNTAPDPPAPAEDKPGEAKSSTDDGSVTLTVDVPRDATLFVNGARTSSAGVTRTFVSRHLESGLNYTYHVRAEISRDGVVIEDSKSVTLQRGERSHLSFTFPQPQVETVLTVRVPEEARVFLAGRESESTGTARTFRTRALAPGEAWENYHIRVTLERDGKLLHEDRRITLRSGDTMVLNFSKIINTGGPRVAATR